MKLEHTQMPFSTSRTDRESMVALILSAREKELRFMEAEILQLRNLLRSMRARSLSLGGQS